MRALLLLSFALFLTSCATNSERRIQRNPELYASLSKRDKDLVQRGAVAEGMSRDAVFLAWGRPGRVMSGSRSGRGRERWAYFSTAPVSNISVGYGYGGYGPHPFYSRFGVHPLYGYGYGPGWGYGSGVDFVPVIDRTVEFENGKVVAWERLR